MTFYKLLKILTATKKGTRMTQIRQGETRIKTDFYLIIFKKSAFIRVFTLISR